MWLELGTGTDSTLNIYNPFTFFHSFNPYLESIRSTSRASEYQRDSVFIATISGSVSISTFLPQSLFGTVSMNVYIHNISLVSPLLL